METPAPTKFVKQFMVKMVVQKIPPRIVHGSENREDNLCHVFLDGGEAALGDGDGTLSGVSHTAQRGGGDGDLDPLLVKAAHREEMDPMLNIPLYVEVVGAERDGPR